MARGGGGLLSGSPPGVSKPIMSPSAANAPRDLFGYAGGQMGINRVRPDGTIATPPGGLSRNPSFAPPHKPPSSH